jgi:taurine dioxygenase
MTLLSKNGFSIRPLPVGAEIVGLARESEAEPGVRRDLYDAWLRYGVLLFRGVDSIERHLSISQCFGELEIHPVPEFRFEQNPYLVELGGPTRAAAYVYDSDVRVVRIPWHRDTAFTPDVCKGAMLRMLEVPTHAGETMLSDTAMAYDSLPASMKARLEGLEYKATLRTDPLGQTPPGAFWTTVRLATEEEDPEVTSRRKLSNSTRYPSVVQPALLTHPESGRKCIFLDPKDFNFFLGMEQGESDELLRYLVDHMVQPKYVYKHKWAVNDAILWDNRRCMHAACGYRPDESRYGQRTTLAGPVRTGRYFDTNVQQPPISTLMD